MRRRAFVAIAAFAALVAAFVATSISTAAPPGVLKAADLFAGQTTDVGDIFVWNDATNVKIQIVLDSGWCMTESHVAAATTPAGIPQTKTGNPIPGKFPLKENYLPCEQVGDEFSFPIATVGATPYIAVHAVVWEEGSLTTTTIISRPGVALVGGGTAVPSTEPGVGVAYPNCPAGDNDATASLWDDNAKLAGNVTPNWGGADWIWNAPYPEYPKNVTGEVVGFSDTFNISGLPVGGSLMITTDNAYRAVLNGGAVGQAQLGPGFPGTLLETVVPGAPQSGNWGVASQGWQSVEQYALSGLKTGANVLGITAANEYLWNDGGFLGPDFYFGTWDPSGPPINADSAGDYQCINPAGLIYKLSVDSYTHSETAWAGQPVGATQFPGANWATYIHPSATNTTFCPSAANTIYNANFVVNQTTECLIASTSTVNGYITMTGGTLRVNGHVTGNLEQFGDGGGLVVQDGAVVVGNVTEHGVGFLRVDDTAHVTGYVTEFEDGNIATTVAANITGNLFEWGNGDITLGGATLVNGNVTENGPGGITVAGTATVTGTVMANP